MKPRTIENLADGISGIRYGEPGKILFDYAGQEIAIREPRDIMLVGYDKPAALWIARNYGFLLANCFN